MIVLLAEVTFHERQEIDMAGVEGFPGIVVENIKPQASPCVGRVRAMRQDLQASEVV